jgi:hypothetical protein
MLPDGGQFPQTAWLSIAEDSHIQPSVYSNHLFVSITTIFQLQILLKSNGKWRGY